MTLTTILIALAAFALGYLLGRVELLLDSVRGSNMPQNAGFFAKTSTVRAQRDAVSAPTPVIEIDERKVVSQIETDTLQKVTDIQLGKQVVASDDINAAVSKLSSLKRN